MGSSLPDPDAQLGTRRFLESPYPTYAQLRRTEPIFWSNAWNCWLLTRYRDCLETLRDTKRFTNVGRVALYLDTLPDDVRIRCQPLYDHFAGGLQHSDPPDHTRIQALVIKAFTPRAVKRMRDRVQQVVHQLLDAVAARKEMDVVRDLAFPLPIRVFCEMFGFPTNQLQQFKNWSHEIAAFHGTGRADPTQVERSQKALLAARRWLSRLIADRRKNPRDDLLTALALAEDRGDRLSEGELFSTCITFMVGGHETTTNLIGVGMLTLINNPDQLERLQNDTDSIETAVEELLRYDSPTQRAHRLAAHDMQLDGKQIRQGQMVQPVLGAANRDPEQFPEPDHFDVTRAPNRHLTFGVGAHICPGAPLARMEGQIAIRTLLERLTSIRLTPGGTPVWNSNNLFRGLTSLAIAFD